MVSADAVKVRKENAEQMRNFLSAKELLLRGIKAKRNEDYVFFAVTKKFANEDFPQLKKIGFSFCKESFEQAEKKGGNIKDFLKGKLPEKEIDLAVNSFDLLGNVAIIEIPKELGKKEKLIASALMQANPSVESVFKKAGAHSGVFRAEPVELVAGKKTDYAYYKESGCTFRISLGKVFFSPRLSYERERIAKQIKKGEIVAALFAGVGPFPIIFAKNSKMKKAYAVELNPVAFQDMVENVMQNKVEDKVIPVLADVKEFCPKFLKGKCDRAVMPLPMGAEHFLKEAMQCIKPKGGIVSFYSFVDRKKPYDKSIAKIKKVAKSIGKSVKVVFKREVRDYSPDTVQIVVDFFVKGGKKSGR